MRILQARYGSGAEFLRHYQPSFSEGGLFYPTREAIDEGTLVLVEVRIPELPQRVLLRGRVAWRRPGRNRTKLRAGLGIEFASADAVRRDFLLRVARGEVPVAALPVRRQRRLPVDIPVMWRVVEGRHEHGGYVEDISAGGAFVRAGGAPGPGTDVVLELVPPGSVVPLGIAARIAWVRGGHGAGFGVEFRSRDAGGLRRLKELVRRLEADENAQLVIFDDEDTDVDDLAEEEGSEAAPHPASPDEVAPESAITDVDIEPAFDHETTPLR